MTYAAATLTEQQFEERFAPYRAENGDLFTFEEVRDAPINTVWTVVEAGDDWMAVPGFAVVNRLGYLRSKRAWTEGQADALYIEGFENDDEDSDGEGV